MANLVLRLTKGSPLTHAELDANFTLLDDEIHTNEANIVALQNIATQVSTSAPTTNVDGTIPILQGAGWFNPVLNSFNIYDGTQWVDVGSSVQTGSFATPPTPATAGDTFYDPATTTMYAYDGSGWVPLGSSAPVQNTPPIPAVTGDLWYDNSVGENVLKVYDGGVWQPAGRSTGWLAASASDPTARDDGTSLLHGDSYYNTSDNVLYTFDAPNTRWIQTAGASVLGAKAANPGMRNDLSALQAGDTYYNTTNSELMVYNGTSWSSVNVEVISDLDDVDTTGVADKHTLVYDNASSTWKSVAPGAANIVVPSGPTGGEPTPAIAGDLYYDTTTGELMIHNGSGWESSNVDVIDDLDDVDTTSSAPLAGQALVWDNVNSKWIPGSGGSASWLDAAAADPTNRPDGTAIQHGDTYFNTGSNSIFSYDAPNTQWIQVSGGSTLGGKAADPGTRNDGSPLQVGDTYYNTTNNEQMVYDGTNFRSVNTDVISDLDDVDTTGVVAGDKLVYNGTTWVVSDATGVPTGPTGSEPASPNLGDLYYNTTTGELTVWNGGAWESANVDVISDLDDVDTTGVATNDKLLWDGAKWAPSKASVTPSGPTGSEPAGTDGDLYYDTTLNELMYFDGTNWTPVDNSFASIAFNGVTGTGATAGDLTFTLADGSTTTVNLDGRYVQTVNGVLPDAAGNVATAITEVTTGVLASRPATAGEGNVYVVSGDPTPAENGKAFIYDTTSAAWYEISPPNLASLDARYVNYTDSIDTLGDVDTTTTPAAIGDRLEYNGTNWVNVTPSGNVVVPTGPTGSEPASPALGDLYYDTTTDELMIYDGGWKSVNVDVISDLDDVDTTGGIVNGQSLVWDGAKWVPGSGGSASWLDAAAADPVTRADGTAIQEGDTYFNTADDVIYSWDGGAWIQMSSGSTLGGKAADPGTRNDGTALQIGDTYYNTTNNEQMVYDGGAFRSTNVDVISDLDDVDTTGVVAGDHLVYDGTDWKAVTPSTNVIVPSGPTGSEPASPVAGDLYYDTTTNELMVHNGTSWESSNVDVISDLDDVDTTGVAAGDHLVYDGTDWKAVTPSTNVIIPTGPTGSEPASPVAGDLYYDTTTDELMVHDGTNWVSANADVISDLDDVDTTGVASGDKLVWSGTNWVPSSDASIPNGPTGSEPASPSIGDLYYDTTLDELMIFDGTWNSVNVDVISDLDDVNTTGVAAGDRLVWDGAKWIPTGKTTIPSGPTGSEPASPAIGDLYYDTTLGEVMINNGGGSWLSVNVDVISDLDDVNTTGVASGNRLVWNGVNWVPTDKVSLPSGITGSEPASPANGDLYYDITKGEVVVWNGSAWESVNADVISDLDDVDTTGVVAGDHLVYNGTSWLPKPSNDGSVISAQTPAPLTRDDTTALQEGDQYYDTATDTVYFYDNTNWVAVDTTIASVSFDNTTTHDGTDATTRAQNGNLVITLNDATPTTFTVDMDGRYAQSVSGVLPDVNGNVAVSLSDVQVGTEAGRAALGTPAQGTVYVVAGDPDPTKDGKTSIFNANDGTWYDVVGYDQAALDARYINTTESIGALNDVTTTAPASDHLLQFNGTNWVNVAPNSLVLGTIDTHSDVNTTTNPPANGDSLIWNGANWVPGTTSTSVSYTSAANLATAVATAGVEGDELYVSSNGAANGIITDRYIYDGTTWLFTPTGGGVQTVVTDTAGLAAAFAVPAAEGDEIYETSDGTISGVIMKRYSYDGTNWFDSSMKPGAYWVPLAFEGSATTGFGVQGDEIYITQTGAKNETILSRYIHDGTSWVKTVLGAQYIDDLLDADTTNIVPTTNTSYLMWNGVNWVPSDLTDGSPDGGATDDF